MCSSGWNCFRLRVMKEKWLGSCTWLSERLGVVRKRRAVRPRCLGGQTGAGWGLHKDCIHSLFLLHCSLLAGDLLRGRGALILTNSGLRSYTFSAMLPNTALLCHIQLRHCAILQCIINCRNKFSLMWWSVSLFVMVRLEGPLLTSCHKLGTPEPQGGTQEQALILDFGLSPGWEWLLCCLLTKWKKEWVYFWNWVREDHYVLGGGRCLLRWHIKSTWYLLSSHHTFSVPSVHPVN